VLAVTKATELVELGGGALSIDDVGWWSAPANSAAAQENKEFGPQHSGDTEKAES
jgi:hypothetical protein